MNLACSTISTTETKIDKTTQETTSTQLIKLPYTVNLYTKSNLVAIINIYSKLNNKTVIGWCIIWLPTAMPGMILEQKTYLHPEITLDEHVSIFGENLNRSWGEYTGWYRKKESDKFYANSHLEVQNLVKEYALKQMQTLINVLTNEENDS